MFSGLDFIIGAGGPQGAGQPRSIDVPMGTNLSNNHQSLCPPYLVVHRNNMDVRSLNAPMPTVTARGSLGIAQPWLINMKGQSTASSLESPLPTVTAHAAHMALCEPFAVHCEHTTEGHERRCYPLSKPLPTITGKCSIGIVWPTLQASEGARGGGDACQCKDASGKCKGRDNILALPSYLTKFHGDHKGKQDGERRAHSLEESLRTLDASNRYGLAQPFVVKMYQGSTACSIDQPLPTITAN